MDKLSYALGQNIGLQLNDMNLRGKLNVNDFAAAIDDVLNGRQSQLSAEEVHRVLDDFFTREEERRQAAAAEQGRAAKSAGEAFLKENAKKPGVVTLPSGLQYEVLNEGTGRRPKATDTVRCHYEGTLVDGTVFDSSYSRGVPAEFGLQQVIAGWTEGLQLMKEGGKTRFFIPYLLGYGPSGAGNSIPPYAALIFDVELIKVM